MQLVKLVFESLCRALIRFFDNRFIRNTDVEWYRMELIKSREETQSLYQSLLQPKVISNDEKEIEDFQPLNNSKYISPATKRRQLEQESYQRATKLRDEARVAIERNKTTDELELELLGDDRLNGNN